MIFYVDNIPEFFKIYIPNGMAKRHTEILYKIYIIN